jgi:hypothetical protein
MVRSRVDRENGDRPPRAQRWRDHHVRVYAAWLAEADQRASAGLAARMPVRPTQSSSPGERAMAQPATPREHLAELRERITGRGVRRRGRPAGDQATCAGTRAASIAERHARTPAQAVLRWHLQLGNVVIPKSTIVSRIRGSIALFDLALTDADMAALGGLGTSTRLGPDRDERRRPGVSPAPAAAGRRDREKQAPAGWPRAAS